MKANWEWKDDNDLWMPYDHKDNMLIETAYLANGRKGTFSTTALSFNTEYLSTYVYDFGKLCQKNLDSSRVRKLRRIETSEDEDEIGFVDMLVKVSSFIGGGHALEEKDEEPSAKKSKLELPSFGFSADAPLSAIKKPATMAAAGWGIPAPPGGFSAPAAAVPPTAPPPPSAATTTTAAGGIVPISLVPSVDDGVVAAQIALGAQSRRHQAYDLGAVGSDAHGKSCFDKMLYREKQLCGEFAVFYHSYSFAALLYEVQAAVAAVLFRFKSEFASLPRLLKGPYDDLPDADALKKLFPSLPSRDHDPKFRAVAISATSSLLANDSEAPPKNVFLAGYSCADLSFVSVLENLLVSCGVPASMKASLAAKIIEQSGLHGLDVSQFKGKPCKSGRPGHMLQIFVKRSIVDRFVYAALPFGVADKTRPVLSKYMEGAGPIMGQVRIVTNPSVFMRGSAVRMYVYSADTTFHTNRPAFQKELTAMLDPIIGKSELRLKAAEGIYGGKVPAWFNPDDKDGTAGVATKGKDA